MHVTDIDGFDALIPSLASSSESLVIDSGTSFHTTYRHEIFQDYMKGEVGKMYLKMMNPVTLSGKAISWLASQMARC